MKLTDSKVYVIYVDDPVSIGYADECVASAAQFNISVTRFKGYYNETSIDRMVADTGLSMSQHKGESCCTSSHVMIWKEIAGWEHPGVILEHDAIIKHDYRDIEIADGELLFLGPKIFDKQDYEFPGLPLEKIAVRRFEGTHAYAITPSTAKTMLNHLSKSGSISTTVDGYLGISNKFSLNMLCLDPPCVLAVTGNKQSFAHGGESGWYNNQALPGFKAGFRVPFDDEIKSTLVKK